MLSQAARAHWRATEVLQRGRGRDHDLQVIVSIMLPCHWTLPEINRENHSSRIQLSSPDGSTELLWQVSRNASFTSLEKTARKDKR